MGRQLSDIKISGTFDGLSFYHHKVYGPLVRRKTGPSRKQVKSGKNFTNTRRQNKEFGGVSHDNKLLRKGLGDLLKRESTIASRLQTVLWQVIKCDTKSKWGERTVSKGLAPAQGKQILKGYEFHAAQAFMDQLDVETGDGLVKIRLHKKPVQSKTKPCLAITVGTIGLDFSGHTTELSRGPVVIFTGSAPSSRLAVPFPVCKKEWPYQCVVLHVQKASKVKNDIIIKENAGCSLTILKVMNGSGQRSE